MFGSQTATLTRQKENVAPKDDVSIQIDDSIYKLPDQNHLELGDGFINVLGVEANDLLDSNFITKQEENVALEQIKQDYNLMRLKILLIREISIKVLNVFTEETTKVLFKVSNF